MGYTHYFHQQSDCPPAAWERIVSDFARCLQNPSAPPVAREFDRPDDYPDMTADDIIFNGIGRDGHETMHVARVRELPPEGTSPRDLDRVGFCFCKTAAKPYDSLVTALLILMQHHAPGVWTISSDGQPADWTAGLALVTPVIPPDVR